MRIPDNYDAWCEYDRRQQKKLDRLPKCAWCGEPIYEKGYRIDDDLVCPECIEDTIEYVEEDD